MTSSPKYKRDLSVKEESRLTLLISAFEKALGNLYKEEIINIHTSETLMDIACSELRFNQMMTYYYQYKEQLDKEQEENKKRELSEDELLALKLAGVEVIETGTKSICILSGGLDSTTLLYKLLKEGKEVYALSFFYNQKHQIELEKARATCKKLKVPHKIIDISFLNDITENSLTRNDFEVPEGHYESESMKDTVVYNRNPIMSNIALSYALTIGAKEIALGIHSGDHAIYEDCRPEALSALQKTADIWNKGIKFIAPYINTDKTGIVKDGLKLGVDYSLTHTCYNGGEVACGKCGSCQERLEAFKLNCKRDPISYIDSEKETLKETEELNEEIADIIKLANEKNIIGAKKYGKFKFEKANMLEEIEEEMLDSINYMCYQIIKMRRLDLKINNK